MKKTIIMMTLCLVAYCCPVQAQHLKFMGIPLNGTITQFQQKLTAKGVKYEKHASEILSAGTRAFTGTFTGENASFLVSYDPSTKIVYRATAIMGYSSASVCDIKFEKMKSMLSSKYPDAITVTDFENGHEKYRFTIYDSKQKPLGVIQLFIGSNVHAYPQEYELYIDYTDYENYEKNDNSKMRDL